MGIFGNNHQPPPRHPRVAANDYKPGFETAQLTVCDRCHTARAKVEVITDAGSFFLCEHHHRMYHDSIIAAGHQIRGRLDPWSLAFDTTAANR